MLAMFPLEDERRALPLDRLDDPRVDAEHDLPHGEDRGIQRMGQRRHEGIDLGIPGHGARLPAWDAPGPRAR
jgi:hypothetical protein